MSDEKNLTNTDETEDVTGHVFINPKDDLGREDELSVRNRDAQPSVRNRDAAPSLRNRDSQPSVRNR